MNALATANHHQPLTSNDASLVNPTVRKALAWSFIFCFVVMTIWAMLMVEVINPLIKDRTLVGCGWVAVAHG